MKPDNRLRLSGLFFAVIASSISAYLHCGGLCLESPAYAAIDDPSTNSQHNHTAVVTTKPPSISEELEVLSRRAEDIYDLAKANKWKSIEKILGALKNSEHPLGFLQNEESVMLLPRLKKTISDLEESISTRKRMETMRLANKITLIEVAMAGSLKPRIPSSAGLLAYYGRALGIWSEAKNMEKLSYIVVRMHIAWHSLIPQFSTQNDIKEIKKFAGIMKSLDLAKTPEEYARLATQVQVEVDNLKKAFKSEPLHSKLQGITK